MLPSSAVRRPDVTAPRPARQPRDARALDEGSAAVSAAAALDDRMPAPARPVPPALPERSGFLALLPLTCAVHCLATPLLVAFVPVLALPPSIEWILLLLSMVVAAVALLRGRRFHRRAGVWVLAVAGAVIWLLSLLSAFEPIPEVLTSPPGGIMLGAGLLWNGRLIHRQACERCGCPMH